MDLYEVYTSLIQKRKKHRKIDAYSWEILKLRCNVLLMLLIKMLTYMEA